jgi:hypothetical protein
MNREINSGKILIIVKGGVVQSVYSSNQSVIIDILDFDNEELSNHDAEEKELAKRRKGLVPLF